MITDDKTITTAEYWDKIYSGNNKDAKVDSSNTKRVSTFNRFEIVVKHVLPDEHFIIDIGSGHAHICKRIAAMKKDDLDSFILASDQCKEAKKIANYKPYEIFSAYLIPAKDKVADLVICTQALEYMEFPEKFLAEAKRVGKKLLVTVPKGEMSAWSQLRIYTEQNTKAFFEQYGTIEVFEVYEHLILVKIRFND